MKRTRRSDGTCAGSGARPAFSAHLGAEGLHGRCEVCGAFLRLEAKLMPVHLARG